MCPRAHRVSLVRVSPRAIIWRMCGIFCLFDLEAAASPAARDLALKAARLLRHRGPDWSGILADERAILAHERLAIVDVLHGAQPLRRLDGQPGARGQRRDLQPPRSARRLRDHDFRTDSDCEVILPLYAREGRPASTACADLRVRPLRRRPGRLAHRARSDRDHPALRRRREETARSRWRPRSRRWSRSATTSRSSPRATTRPAAIPSRCATTRRTGSSSTPFRTARSTRARSTTRCPTRCTRHLMTDVPYGVLLSGGLDSSVIGALAAGFAGKRVEAGDREAAWWPRLHSFAIGLAGSPDLAAAKRAADGIGTVHHGFDFTVQEGIDALRDVIWHIESFDMTTVRASTPMYLMARRIRATGVKMVLSGEGSDEIFGGYLYFHKAPHPRAFHEELVRKLHLLHLYDCLRANKSMAAWGIEARVPFLDTRFLDVAMRIPARHKMVAPGGIEKQILREAFRGALPDEILWRQKEQFSDGVGYSWIDSLKAHAEARVTDRQLAHARRPFPDRHAGDQGELPLPRDLRGAVPASVRRRVRPSGPSVACSSPAALEWDPSFKANADPSGRAVKGVHKHSG